MKAQNLRNFCLIALFTLLLPFLAQAQTNKSYTFNENTNVSSWKSYSRFERPFKQLDLALMASSTGFGLEFAYPLHRNIGVRAGFTYMPKITQTLNFQVEGVNGISSFEKMADLYHDMFGIQVDDQIDMDGEVKFYNFNLLFDFYPFKNKDWYITAGAYIGPKEIARACNKTEEAPSLLAVSMYNNLYGKIYDNAVINTDADFENDEPLNLFGFDVDLGTERQLEIVEEGRNRVGINVGKHKDGTPYIMEPDKDSMVKVKMRTKLAVRPYLGFGYGREFVKGYDKFRFAVEAGVMYWGGIPEVTTHDGTDLVNDLGVIHHSKVSRYVDIVKKFPIYPVLNLKIVYKLF